MAPTTPNDGWTIDGDPDALPFEIEPATPETGVRPVRPEPQPLPETRPTLPQPVPPRLMPTTMAPSVVPPPAETIAEAMLFVGGPPLTPHLFATAVRVPGETLIEAVNQLNRKYKSQNRPYSIVPKDGGYLLAVKPQFQSLREKLFRGPRETRLSQPSLDVLSLVAYRQPIAKPELDAIRGSDSGGSVRQLLRLGLVAVVHRGETDRTEVRYGTTAKFLEMFGLSSPDDLPRPAETQKLT